MLGKKSLIYTSYLRSYHVNGTNLNKAVTLNVASALAATQRPQNIASDKFYSKISSAQNKKTHQKVLEMRLKWGIMEKETV